MRAPAAPIARPAAVWLGPLGLALAFIALAAWSWRKWADPFIDFGSQLYIPWRLAEGTALYRDLEYKDGPLSQYLNALLFRVFGVSLTTLVWANLALLALLATLTYQIAARATDRTTAALVVFVLLTVFGFSQYTEIGNYNYVCPYAHEQTHGIVLAVALIAAFAGGRPGLAGLALGGVFLTKAELFVPAVGAAAVGLAFSAAAARRDDRWTRTVLLPFVAGAVVPPGIAFAALALAMPARTAFRGVAGNWWHLRGGIVDYGFYGDLMGLDDAPGNATRALRLFGAIVAWTAAAVLVSVPIRTRRRLATVLGVGGGIGIMATLVVFPAAIAWRELARPLPLTTATILIAVMVIAWRRRHDPLALRRLAAPAMWATLALLLLVKVLLHVRFSHYGFVLAMPATLLLAGTLAWAVPALVAARGGSDLTTRVILLATILAGVGSLLQTSQIAYARKQLAIGTGGDVMMTGTPEWDPRGIALVRAAAELRTRMAPGSTLMAVPEGPLLNYWLRAPNPTRHVYFVPWSLDFAGGEDVVLADIQATPPDFIALTHRPGTEYGAGWFGVDARYGRRLLNWIRRAYRRVAVIGQEPLTTSGRFGILVLERINANVPANVPANTNVPADRPATKPTGQGPDPHPDDPSA